MVDIDPRGDDWSEWRNYVLKELERLHNNFEALREKYTESRLDIRELQIKYSIITIITEVIILAAYYFLTHL